MRNRKDILSDLIGLKGNFESHITELSKYPWDSEDELYVITKNDITIALEKFLSEEITALELENWANAIECRDDVGFEFEPIQKVVFILANPLLNGGFDIESAGELLKEMKV